MSIIHVYSIHVNTFRQNKH